MRDQTITLRANGVETAVLAVKELADDSSYTVITLSWDGVQQRVIEAGHEIVFCHHKALFSCDNRLKVF